MSKKTHPTGYPKMSVRSVRQTIGESRRAKQHRRSISVCAPQVNEYYVLLAETKQKKTKHTYSKNGIQLPIVFMYSV